MTTIKFKVTETSVKIVEKSDILTSGNIESIKCYFDLPESFDNLVVRATFGNKSVILINGECYAPELEEGNIEIGVYAYDVSDGKIILRISPRPCCEKVYKGSYNSNIANASHSYPSELEVYYKSIENLKSYTDNLSYLEKLTLTQETAKMISADGIVGYANYISDENCFNIQIYAPIKEYGKSWKIEPFEEDEKFDDFIVSGYTSNEDGEEPEYLEVTKAMLDEAFDMPFYTGQYSRYVRWCGIKWIYSQCFFGYSNAWDFTPVIQNLETEEEKQAFINEVEEMVKAFNTDFETFSIDKISVIKTVHNLPIKERIVS